MTTASHPAMFPPRRAAFMAIAVAVITAGCASGPDYRAPATPETAAAPFVSKPPDTDTAASLPAEWWKLYDDPALDHLVQESLSANTNLRVTLANLDRARAIYKEARGGLFPSTTVSAGAGYGRDQSTWTGTGRAPTQWSYSGGLDVSYELDLFGRVRRDIEATRDDTDAVAAAHDAARVLVVAETTRAYVDACTYGESIGVAHSSIELAQRSLDLINRQEHAGSASHLDVERAGVTLAQARAALPPLQGQRDAALFELAALMGRTPSQVPESARACTQTPEIAGALPIGDGTALLRRRPDLRQAERQLAADTARIGVAVADLYPRVTLGASGNYLRNDYLKGNRTWSFSLGPLISWSVPNTMVARSRIAQAKAQSAASLASFDGAVLNALKESEQALSAYGAAMQQREALIEARERAEKAFQLADQRYRAGSISYLDVIVAQTRLIDTRSQVAAADQRAGSARVSVFKALGGGWEEPAAQ
ncbi:NodT family efflux transporter outer membrane factor (OMF) lipoprotein [Variovorax boronicumulans]|uniref:NodT family efflux transporter outer membrane factor (OMF) lipoprotein n=1 Tax=Variovorax boronicumulans TaxID=436515 RepID=A0AAW8D0I9_9BURK|nr:TolC family protein [Variovorax boronicumulans]MDP9894996.1 NodT family efflux transporter outer membrane factor (OMF) lipoprotein [Variovorax boronicumulans]MDQ0038490.1 NodT family efflux transporter outer membrane factor (OMF) lipoprotein [Variovorax boronicumulans]MDQ0054684.1 NodT family efflux transporter outer membrane factor (OMF) lipoprotein [Variovorax boronicumulans]